MIALRYEGSEGNNFLKIRLFLIITFVLSWGMTWTYFGLGGRVSQPLFYVISVAVMFTPFLAALVVQRLVCRQPFLGPLGLVVRPNRWYVAGLFVPPLLAMLSAAASLLVPGVTLSADIFDANIMKTLGEAVPSEQMAQVRRQIASLPLHPAWLILVGGTLVGATVNAVAALGEEVGWRGLLYMELAHLGFWRSSWLIGLVWGAWHAPMILNGYNYPGHPVAGVALMVVWAILFSPLIGYVRSRTGSVVAAAMMHGSLNGVGMAPAAILTGGDSLTTGILGIPGIGVLTVLNVCLYFFIGKKGVSG